MMSPHDEYEFLEDSDLLRRIHPDQIIFDNNINDWRPTSQNFNHEMMSIDIEKILIDKRLDWNFTLLGYEQYSLVRFSIKLARQLNQTVFHCRTQENPAHGEVRGRKTGSIRSKFSKCSNWVRLNPPSPP